MDGEVGEVETKQRGGRRPGAGRKGGPLWKGELGLALDAERKKVAAWTELDLPIPRLKLGEVVREPWDGESLAEEAIRAILYVLRNSDTPTGHRLTAAQMILDQVKGRPIQRVQMTVGIMTIRDLVPEPMSSRPAAAQVVESVALPPSLEQLCPAVRPPVTSADVGEPTLAPIK